MLKTVILSILVLAFVSILAAQEVYQWRGSNRDGIYNELGLLKSWPENGPKLMWSNELLPDGHSSVAFTKKSMFLTGTVDNMDVLIALDLNGNIKWKLPYGRAWNQSFPESRCTPTIEENRIYVSSGIGDIACIDADNAKVIWSLKAAEEYSADLKDWGIAENLIIDGNKVIFSPIGKQTTVIAIDKLTGQLIWKSESINDAAAYVSPIIFNYAGKNIIVNISASYIFGVNAENGNILWKFNHKELMPSPEDWGPLIKCTSPLYFNGKVFFTGGYDHVGAMLKMNSDASKVELIWADKTLDNHHGGVVKVGNYIYGSNWINNGMGNWCCIDWNSGKVMYETKWKNKGSIIANDEMLYCYDEKGGNVALVKATPEKFEPVSSFKVNAGKGPYWSHPVINDGILYLRHGTALMAYSLKP